MQTLTQLIKTSLYMPDEALKYELSLAMHGIFPDHYILETEDCDFDLRAFAAAGRCSVRLLDDAHAQLEAEWRSLELGGSLVARNAFQQVDWNGSRLRVLALTYGTCETRRHYIVADQMSVAKDFFARVCSFSSEVQGEILVFRNGWWQKDKSLLTQIASATLEGLVLPDELREALTLDFAGFFEGRAMYERQGVAWKRGILMLGPPGNGKTHAIKALVNSLGKPCLYVRSFKPARGTVHGCIERVFHRARQASPCMLILEDLDTLIDRQNLAFFLNEMDGFASNHGILTVATTNHPDKLDPAILDRPSRFDRKITFNLPGRSERLAFLARANAAREPELQISSEELEDLATRTEGFSFAYLKELGLSGMMAWMRECRPGEMGRAMLTQVESLRAQMKTEPVKQAPSAQEDDDGEGD